MTQALEVLGWVIFLAMIAFSIGMHEIGHLVPAKAFGVRVTQYMVGFGPTLWSRVRGETEYGIKAIPLGGYIRMIGMYPPAKSGAASPSGRWAAHIEQSRQHALEDIGPDDADRVFYKLSVPKRIVVMLGGPVMNLVLAVVFTALVLCGFGLVQPTTTVQEVSACVPSASSTGAASAAACTGPASPAAAAGLKPGDRIEQINRTPVSTWQEAASAIKASPTGPVPVVVVRDGQTLTLTADLVAIPRPVLGPDGQPTGQTETHPFLGVLPAVDRVAQPPSAVPAMLWDQTRASVGALVTLPVMVWDLAQSLGTDTPRSTTSPVSVVGAGRIAGEAVANQSASVTDRVAFLFSLLAALNLFLFLFNLVPLLPLDGGHVAGALWEGLKRGWARVRHLPDPGPVDLAKALPLTYAVSLALLMLGTVVILADLIKPVSLTG